MNATKPVAIGLTCGIGSMLIGAKKAGFHVIGNIEWRTYYHTGTFQRNFKNSFMVKRMMDAIGLIPDEIELAMGHPECGKYSQLNPDRASMTNDPGDIPLFINMVKELKPRYFVMDDLPMSFIAFPMEKYVEMLPDYDLFPEWVSNWGYGNVQKGRNRMFMIGALKSEGFVFQAREKSNEGLKVSDILGDIYNQFDQGIPNHIPHSLKSNASRGSSIRKHGERHTWAEVQEHLSSKPQGYYFQYVSRSGEIKRRFATVKGYWDRSCHVIHGGALIHPLTNLPMSIRERARIQGFPDDFVFVGEVLESDGTWVHDRNNKLIKQTGKAMPIQFCTHAAKEAMRGILGKPIKGASTRILKENPYVTEAKQWFCKEIGYSQQHLACSNCWTNKRCSVQALALARSGLKLELPAVQQLEIPSEVSAKRLESLAE
jgi:DNA (cytosine-5)-methyltransferase 1